MTRSRDEQGSTLVLMAVAMTAILAMVGLAIDGGAAYSDRRQAQNAADAAALAGTAEVDKFIRLEHATPASVMNAVIEAAQDENRSNQRPICKYIDQTGATIDESNAPVSEESAPECDAVAGIPTAAAGVLVIASDRQRTLFMRVVGIGSFKAAARSKATIQSASAATVGAFGSPFMLCAAGDGDRRSPGTDDGYDAGEGLRLVPLILEPPTGVSNDTLIINPDALGQNYPIQYPNGNRPEFPRCGLGNNWKGGVDPFPLNTDAAVSYPIPGPWPGSTGDFGTNGGQAIKAFSIPGTCVTSAFDDDNYTGCLIDLPLCYPNTATTLRCIGRGRFALQDSGRSSELNGIFLGQTPDVVGGGQGGTRPDAGGQRVIKLIE